MSELPLSSRVSNNFADAKTRILVIVGLIVVLVMVVGGVLYTGSSGPGPQSSSRARVGELSTAPTLSRTEIGATQSARVEELKRLAEEEAIRRAQTDGSSLITSLDLRSQTNLGDGLAVVNENEPETLPRNSLRDDTPRVRVANLKSRAIQAPRKVVQETAPAPVATPVPARDEDPERYNLMLDAMAQLLVPYQAAPQEVKVFVDPQTYVPPQQQSIAGQQYTSAAPQLAVAETIAIDEPLEPQNTSRARLNRTVNSGDEELSKLDRKVIRAGDILYARTITRSLSTVPSAVIAEIVEGDLKGTRLIGSFSQNYDRLSLRFGKGTLPDGTSLDTELVAIDPGTTLTSLATDVDYHTWERVVLAAGSAFVSGFADSLASVDSTTVTGSDGGSTTSQQEADLSDSFFAGLSSAAQEWNAEIQREAERYQQPTVYVTEGHMMGLVALSDSYREIAR